MQFAAAEALLKVARKAAIDGLDEIAGRGVELLDHGLDFTRHPRRLGRGGRETAGHAAAQSWRQVGRLSPLGGFCLGVRGHALGSSLAAVAHEPRHVDARTRHIEPARLPFHHVGERVECCNLIGHHAAHGIGVAARLLRQFQYGALQLVAGGVDFLDHLLRRDAHVLGGLLEVAGGCRQHLVHRMHGALVLFAQNPRGLNDLAAGGRFQLADLPFEIFGDGRRLRGNDARNVGGARFGRGKRFLDHGHVAGHHRIDLGGALVGVADEAVEGILAADQNALHFSVELVDRALDEARHLVQLLGDAGAGHFQFAGQLHGYAFEALVDRRGGGRKLVGEIGIGSLDMARELAVRLVEFGIGGGRGGVEFLRRPVDAVDQEARVLFQAAGDLQRGLAQPVREGIAGLAEIVENLAAGRVDDFGETRAGALETARNVAGDAFKQGGRHIETLAQVARGVVDAREHRAARVVELGGDVVRGFFQALRHQLVGLRHLARDAHRRFGESIGHAGGGRVELFRHHLGVGAEQRGEFGGRPVELLGERHGAGVEQFRQALRRLVELLRHEPRVGSEQAGEFRRGLAQLGVEPRGGRFEQAAQLPRGLIEARRQGFGDGRDFFGDFARRHIDVIGNARGRLLDLAGHAHGDLVEPLIERPGGGLDLPRHAGGGGVETAVDLMGGVLDPRCQFGRGAVEETEEIVAGLAHLVHEFPGDGDQLVGDEAAGILDVLSQRDTGLLHLASEDAGRFLEMGGNGAAGGHQQIVDGGTGRLQLAGDAGGRLFDPRLNRIGGADDLVGDRCDGGVHVAVKPLGRAVDAGFKHFRRAAHQRIEAAGCLVELLRGGGDRRGYLTVKLARTSAHAAFEVPRGGPDNLFEAIARFAKAGGRLVDGARDLAMKPAGRAAKPRVQMLGRLADQ